MILHVLNCPPSSGQAAAQALSAMAPGDVLLLIEDGVYAVLDAEWEGHRLGPEKLYALEDDVHARGLMSIANAQKVALVGMETFVALTAQTRQTISWY
ncbi:hypothetical protein GCM10022228_19390 [Halomonas cibimaris]|uniref:Sulfurtransferase complex subunit TusB n=1 Tax=Halomonas cibimaris TaxID=657012 RepID=A0ABP7LWT1_9GAMM